MEPPRRQGRQVIFSLGALRPWRLIRRLPRIVDYLAEQRRDPAAIALGALKPLVERLPLERVEGPLLDVVDLGEGTIELGSPPAQIRDDPTALPHRRLSVPPL